MNEDIIEFYHRGKDMPFTSVRSGMVPPVGSHIATKHETFTVVAVTYAVDTNQGVLPVRLRACVDVEPYRPKKKQQRTKGTKV